MGLYERLLGEDATNGKLPIHGFQAVAAEWARGSITGAQAQAAIAYIGRAQLTATEIQEAQDLVAAVTSIAIPTGTTAAQVAARAEAKANRLARLKEIDDVLLMVDRRTPPYDNAATIRTRLGVPTR